VDTIKKGIRSFLPFNVGAASVQTAKRGLSGYWSHLRRSIRHAGMAGAAYGFAGMGPYSGGQAQLLRVPYADYQLFEVAEDADEKEKDYVSVRICFPTGWHAHAACRL